MIAASALWLLGCGAAFSADAPHDPAREWTYWRGPSYDGVSPLTGLPDTWDPDGGPGSNVRWMREELGGRSTPVAMNHRLYTIVRAEPGTPREGERVVCIDPETGETIWENRFNVYLSDVPDTRVGWSSVVADPETNSVYALGVCGLFLCMDADNGQTRWSIPLHERFGLLSTYGGRTNFPIVHEDLVIISGIIIGWGEMARPTHRFIAFDKRTGEVVWFNGTTPLPYDTSYSAPVLRVYNGQPQLIVGAGDGRFWAFQPRTGRPIWQYNLSRRGLNSPPLALADRVIISHSEENITGTTMGALVAVDPTLTGDITESGRLWRVDEVMAGRAAAAVVGGRLWVFDDRAKLQAYDLETGEPVGRRVALGTQMRASPLVADGKVYAITANGRWYILGSDEEGAPEILERGRLPRGYEMHASPMAAYGRVFVQTTGAMYCLQDVAKEPGFEPPSSLPTEDPLGQHANDSQPAWVQVVPAEILVRPGESQSFEARLFNDRGQLLKTTDAQFSLDGPGTVSADGTFTAATDQTQHAAYLTAKVGELEGLARIRVVPDLPWKFDFESIALDPTKGTGEPPVTWVGARYRHVVRDVDGNKVMVKITTIPKGTRSRAWFGHSDLHDYTIQADVRGAVSDGKMPDIGLIAQGYAIDLQGAQQELQIRSWVPQLRMANTVPFSWDPDVWYTMKLMAVDEGDRVVLHGKVWPRDQQEPSDWTVTAVDEAPVRSGSPGLFGNAKDAEIFLDNIQVYPNP